MQSPCKHAPPVTRQDDPVECISPCCSGAKPKATGRVMAEVTCRASEWREGESDAWRDPRRPASCCPSARSLDSWEREGPEACSLRGRSQGRRLRLREDATPLFTEHPPVAACQPRGGRPEAGSLLPGASGSQTRGSSQLTQLGDGVFPQRPVRSESGRRGPVWGAGPFSCRSTVWWEPRAPWQSQVVLLPLRPSLSPALLHPRTRRLCAVGPKGAGERGPGRPGGRSPSTPSG